MATRMQQRRGTAAQWISTNNGNGPILESGEIGFESDTNKFKIGDGVNHWVDLTYFVDGAELSNLVDGAPVLLDTLNELAAAIGDDPAFFTTVATNLSNHQSDTTNIHGIDDTAELATKTYVADAIGNATVDQSALAGAGIDWNLSTEQFDIDSTVATKSFAASLLTGATKSNITISGDENGLIITAENGVADSTTSDLAEGTNLYFTDERAQDAVGNAVGTGLTYTDATGEIKVTPNTYDAYGAASTAASDAATALSNHESDTTNIHGIDDTSKLVTTDGTQTLTNKTITSPSGLVKGDVGLGNVDNTSDADKPVSTATQTALDLKADLAGATFSGAVSVTDTTESTSTSTGAVHTAGGLGVTKNAYIGGDLTISGDFTVNGTTTTVSTQDLVVQDPLIYLGESNTANSVDLGIVSSFDDGTYQHSGLVRDASDGKWKLFKGVTDEPTTTVNFAQGSLDSLAVGALEASSLTVGSVSDTEIGYLNGVTSAIQTQLDDKAVYPTQTGNSGKYLTTDGTSASWATLVVPITTTTSTITANTATLIDSIDGFNILAAEYTIRLIQGSKIRTSKVILQGDMNGGDMTEFAITESGGVMSGVVVSAASGVNGPELYVTVTDAASTNVDVKFSKVAL